MHVKSVGGTLKCLLKTGACLIEVATNTGATVFIIELRLANKDAKHKKLLNILCIVYVLARSEPNYYNTSLSLYRLRPRILSFFEAYFTLPSK